LVVGIAFEPLAAAWSGENVVETAVRLFVERRRLLGLYDLEQRGLRHGMIGIVDRTGNNAKASKTGQQRRTLGRQNDML
jgi:hypothetical protein